VLGRARAAPVRLADPAASRRHLRFRVRQGDVAVEDLGSKNGVTVNGEPLGPASRPLGAGDRIALGESVLELELPAVTSPTRVEAVPPEPARAEPPLAEPTAPGSAPRALPPRWLAALLAAAAALLATAAALGLAA
jgi:pSer/pThr/pTyr-binding forkhead associated (FHA) protein